MNADEFIAKLTETLATETELTTNTSLDELEEWDSLGILSVIELIETYNSDIELESIYNSKTVGDLLALTIK